MPTQDQITFNCDATAFRSVKIRNLIITLVIILSLGYAVYSSGHDILTFFKIFLPMAIVMVLIAYGIFYKKITGNFIVNSSGLQIGTNFCGWEKIKGFHMLGDSQNERIGLITIKARGINTGADIVNPYTGTGVFVIRLKNSFFGNTINLQVSPERIDEFNQILVAHNIMRESKIKMLLFETNKWFVILFILPFSVLALFMLLTSLIYR